MAIGSLIFENVVGTPGNPSFVEYLIKGHAVETVGTQQFINQLHFVKVGGLGLPTDLVQLSVAIKAIIDAPLSAALSDTYVADDVTLRALDSPLNLPLSDGNAIVGAITGDRLPSFNSVVTRKYTFGRGRSFRGSNHWGPIAESDTLLDQLTGAAITRWNAVAAAINSLFNFVDSVGNVWSLIVLSQLLSDLTANPSVFTGSQIRLCTANLVIGTMKRRKQRTAA